MVLGGGVQTIEPSPDGRLLAVGQRRTARRSGLDAATLETVRTLGSPATEAGSTCPSPRTGGGSPPAATRGGIQRLRHRQLGPLHAARPGRREFVQELEFLPDGRTLVASGFSGEVALDDVLRGLIRGRPLPGSERPGAGYTHLVPAPPTSSSCSAGSATATATRCGRRSGSPTRARSWGSGTSPRREWSRYLPGRAYEPTCTPWL